MTPSTASPPTIGRPCGLGRGAHRCHPRRCETGSMVVGVALVASVIAMAGAVGMVGIGIAARTQASAAADAAALAAAPVTFAPFGAEGGPAQEAARFAALNRTRLVTCRCPVDRTWRTRTVTVVVARSIRIPMVGTIDVHATSLATFEPLALIPDR